MSAASCLLTEDQFLCSICLDVFTDPVAIPCGHNFCKTCITEHWNIDVPYQCPNCNKVFNARPELQVNTLISEMAVQFRQSAQQKASSSSSEQQVAKPGAVPCDVCTGTKLKGWMFCLLCLMCAILLSKVLNHKTHVVVLLKEGYEAKKAELEKTEAEIQQMIQVSRLKIQEFEHSVELSKEDADREIADGVQVFMALKEYVERSQAEVINTIKEKQRKTEKQAEGFIKELEQEISELMKRSTEVEQLSRSEDHLHLLQSFTSLNAAPPTKNWTGVSIHPPSHVGTVVRAVNQLKEILNEEITNLAAQFRQSAQQKASSNSSEQQVAEPGEVPCDICIGTKLKALKSCLVCLFSYCETHLEPHLTATRLKTHQLIEPVENLEGRMCTKHNKVLELYCKNDQICVCMLCTVLDHKTHDVVPLKDGYEEKKAELGKTEAEIQQMIQKRQWKIYEFKHSVELSKEDADREIADGVQVFTALKESVERSQAELINTIKEKQRKTEKQAEGFIKELEQEISELMKRSAEVEQLSRTEDHLHLLQSFASMNGAPPTKVWTEVNISRLSYEGTVVRAVDQLSKQLKKLHEAELKRVQRSAVDVTLDPDTAHPNLILSDDGKQVHDSDVDKNLPNNPERFDICVNVLAKETFSSGRFYYEVQVQGKTEWTLGVARESINRKGSIKVSPQFGYWTISLTNKNEYYACVEPRVRLFLKPKPQKVGVFVDYEDGLVSFYDADAAAHIYSFTSCSFTEKLLPFFRPSLNYDGKNSAPLIISPVNHTE